MNKSQEIFELFGLKQALLANFGNDPLYKATIVAKSDMSRNRAIETLVSKYGKKAKENLRKFSMDYLNRQLTLVR